MSNVLFYTFDFTNINKFTRAITLHNFFCLLTLKLEDRGTKTKNSRKTQ